MSDRLDDILGPDWMRLDRYIKASGKCERTAYRHMRLGILPYSTVGNVRFIHIGGMRAGLVQRMRGGNPDRPRRRRR
jgi:hypothetical protein